MKNALIKDGWTITHDPFMLRYDDLDVFADLGAERALAAEREGSKIAVEIKSFLQPSLVRELEQAIGQYVVYRSLLDALEPERKLYLAISHLIYDGFFQRPAIQLIVDGSELPLIVVNVENEEVVQWIS